MLADWTPSHLPCSLCALSDWFLWIRFGPDNRGPVTLHHLEARTKQKTGDPCA